MKYLQIIIIILLGYGIWQKHSMKTEYITKEVTKEEIVSTGPTNDVKKITTCEVLPLTLLHNGVVADSNGMTWFPGAYGTNGICVYAGLDGVILQKFDDSGIHIIRNIVDYLYMDINKESKYRSQNIETNEQNSSLQPKA